MPVDGLVQPIVLSRTGSHEDGIRACAAASVAAYINTAEDPVWNQWLRGRFTKTVRRARPVQFDVAGNNAAAATTVGEAHALAFRPTAYEHMATELRKLQVAGTELPRAGWVPVTPGDRRCPVLVLDDSLGLSTGKMCAQAAHALFGWYLQQTEATQAEWRDAGRPFRVTGSDTGIETWVQRTPSLVIHDAAFTELAAPAATVAVFE